MSREYQQGKQKQFLLPFPVYMQCLWFVRDYERLSKIKGERAAAKIKAIDRALEEIPEDYRQGIFENILFHSKFSDLAHENTWKIWKQRFVYYVASNLDLIAGDDIT